jgi:hypothetical protein
VARSLASTLTTNVLAELGIEADDTDVRFLGVKQAVTGAAARLGYRGDMPSTYYTLTPVDVSRIADALAYDLRLSPLDETYPDRLTSLLVAVERTATEIAEAAAPARV